jgi:hypothetical protein
MTCPKFNIIVEARLRLMPTGNTEVGHGGEEQL